MARVRFGAFLAPHHPIGESPHLLLRRDLDLVAQLDQLGYDEFWVGEHHSSGWEMIACPEMFLAGAAQRTSTIKLGTGVISLPYHHPFNVAERIVQLDHMSSGRAIFGAGPGAFPSDAKMLGINPMLQRDRLDEALGVIVRLLSGEDRFDYDSDWFTLHDAQLQLLPLQEKLPMAVASTFSPTGMQLAGKYGCGVISLASTSDAGLQSLLTQWSFAEEAARKYGQTVSRNDWRILMRWHLAETRKQAREEVMTGLKRWYNEYQVDILGRPGATPVDSAWELLDGPADRSVTGATTIIGTPNELVAAIHSIQELTGGLGAILGFVHDWANPEATRRSWDMFARYVIPEVNGQFSALRKSADYMIQNREEFVGQATAAIMAKVRGNERAEAALKMTQQPSSGEWRPMGANVKRVD
jgi:limonene 1,2-monooxygenase